MKKRWFSILLALWMVLSLAPVTALAASGGDSQSDTISIPLTKQWSDAGNEDKRPENITVNLLADGAVVTSITLNANGNWSGKFENLPVKDGSGKEITYTVAEEAVTDYEAAYTQPTAESLSIESWGEKVTPAANPTYSLGSSNLVVANKGNKYYIWTMNVLSEAQRVKLCAAINDANLQGLGKDLTLNNTEFQSGIPASFENGAVSITEDEDGRKITFSTTNVWSLFYAGMLNITEATGASIINTYSASGGEIDPEGGDEPVPIDPPPPIQVTIPARKTLDGKAPGNAAFTFLLKDGAGGEVERKNSSGDGQISFTPLTFSDIGTYQYTVTELAGDDSNIRYDATVYTVKIQIGVDQNTNTLWQEVSFLKNGEPYNGNALVFANTTKEAVGTLVVSKTVSGNKASTSKAFTFTVTLMQNGDTPNGSITYGGVTFTNGVATFKLKHGESKTITGLPAGFTYLVKESDNSGYTVTVNKTKETTATGTIKAGQTATAAFDNNKADNHLNPQENHKPKHNRRSSTTTTVTTSAKTGDMSNLTLWLSLLVTSGSALAGTAAADRRRRRTR